VDRTELAVTQDALLGAEKTLEWLEGRGLTLSTVLDAGLGYIPETARSPYRHCVVIPYFDARGELRGVRYRHLRADAHMKYQTPKGGGVHLYNAAGSNAPVVAICEGEFDALVMKQLGVEAVAIPGTQSWQRAWRWLFRNCDLVYVVMDNDEAGLKASHRIAAQLGDITEAEVVEMPEGFDVSDLYVKDPDRLKELLT
jgi:DNA primase